jgi:His-Xaa-Ser system radical SAM maturase HxsB
MTKFQTVDFYRDKQAAGYSLLPFRFTELDAERYVLTNLAGEFLTIPRASLAPIVRHELSPASPLYTDLLARQFLTDHQSSIATDLLAIKLRTRYERLAEFTRLHIFVVTLRCEHSCLYCQVSRQSDNKLKFDMSRETASAAIDLALRSPAEAIKIEFQGGEPLLNFDLIQYIVTEVKARNTRKALSFVIATNLSLINDEILYFCDMHSILISTSLDGPRDLHNRNRPRPDGDSYERTIQGINGVRARLGRDRVSALMTTTEASLTRSRDIIDEYIVQGFNEIFLRPLAPYGFALKTKSYTAYGVERWLGFYQNGLDYIIDLNKRGIPFRERYAAIILKKMFTNDDPGYVDLMSPAGIGIGAVVFNYDGAVYASDESRMLAEMGDTTFKLGELGVNTYEEIFTSPKLLDPIEQSFAYSAPMCNDCAFEPFCGADPVFHYGRYGDYVGRKPESEFCRRNMGIFRYLIQRMEEEEFVKRLSLRWANNC